MRAYRNLLQKGFTLIELIIVIAIIGILAAVAIPKFIDLSGTAQTSTIQGIAGALASGNAANYAASKVNASMAYSVTNCTDVANTMQGGLPTGYSITSAAIAAPAGTTATCTVTGPNSTTATFSATRTTGSLTP